MSRILTIVVLAVLCLSSAVDVYAEPPGESKAGGPMHAQQHRRRGGHGPEMRTDRDVFHFLLENHDKIRRSVKELDNGVETVTESDDPAVARKIQEHVASMHRRIETGNGLRFWDELFVAIFRNSVQISMKVEKTPRGVRVIETSDNPRIVPLIQAHAKVVSRFVERGFAEAHENHPVPTVDTAVDSLPADSKDSTSAGRPLPEGGLGDVIKLGRELVANTTTHPLTKDYVGNALNCTSCHLKNGTDPRAATFLGTATAYPAWAPREKRVITLEDRILNCFMRSCNGTRPPLGSEPSVAIAAYITWLSSGEPLQPNATRPVGPRAVPKLGLDAAVADVGRGAAIYERRCADCHGSDGLGVEENPPVWGSQSYNDGAGLTNVEHLAAWLKVAMPLDETDLTEQEALDVAAFVNSHQRPHFTLKEHLPPAEKLGRYNGDAEQ